MLGSKEVQQKKLERGGDETEEPRKVEVRIEIRTVTSNPPQFSWKMTPPTFQIWISCHKPDRKEDRGRE